MRPCSRAFPGIGSREDVYHGLAIVESHLPDHGVALFCSDATCQEIRYRDRSETFVGKPLRRQGLRHGPGVFALSVGMEDDDASRFDTLFEPLEKMVCAQRRVRITRLDIPQNELQPQGFHDLHRDVVELSVGRPEEGRGAPIFFL